jgi:hypothetical protein
MGFGLVPVLACCSTMPAMLADAQLATAILAAGRYPAVLEYAAATAILSETAPCYAHIFDCRHTPCSMIDVFCVLAHATHCRHTPCTVTAVCLAVTCYCRHTPCSETAPCYAHIFDCRHTPCSMTDAFRARICRRPRNPCTVTAACDARILPALLAVWTPSAVFA